MYYELLLSLSIMHARTRSLFSFLISCFVFFEEINMMKTKKKRRKKNKKGRSVFFVVIRTLINATSSYCSILISSLHFIMYFINLSFIIILLFIIRGYVVGVSPEITLNSPGELILISIILLLGVATAVL